MRQIDFRSDTVTKPTPAMREAMARAEVGDDVYGEDPTVNRLQERVAALLGKEVSLFFPSGTMANQASLRLLTQPGDVVLASQECHVLKHESGAASALSGLQIRTIGARGAFDGADVRACLAPRDPYFAPVTLLAVENTHNAAGGRVFPPDLLKDAVRAAREAGLVLHLDGARLWNAGVASGAALAELTAPFDSVSVCLSKGLGAPAGSLVATSRERLPRLLRIRKMLGGGMRQAGILAAAGLHALDQHVERLAQDHANARALASGLAALGCEVDPAPETNIVLFATPDALAFARRARERGVWMNPVDARRLRAVTHLDVGADDVAEALQRLA